MNDYITIALPKGKLFRRSRDLLAQVGDLRVEVHASRAALGAAAAAACRRRIRDLRPSQNFSRRGQKWRRETLR